MDDTRPAGKTASGCGKTYRDAFGNTYHSLKEMAAHHVQVPGPLLADVVCPASEYTLAVRKAGDEAWRNVTCHERRELERAIIYTGMCCRNLGGDCELLRGHAQKE